MLSIKSALLMGVMCSGALAQLSFTNFESQPYIPAYEGNDWKSVWTTEQSHSGNHSIKLGEPTPGVEWYKGPRFYHGLPASGNDLIKVDFWSLGGKFYSDNDQANRYEQTNTWVHRQQYVRTRAASQNFGIYSTQTTYIDDLRTSVATPRQYDDYNREQIGNLGTHVTLNSASRTQSRLPNAFQALNTGTKLRVLMLGDSIARDSTASYWDTLVKAANPQADIDLVMSVRGATGMEWYAQTENDTSSVNFGKARVQTWALDYQPDLIVLAGISHGANSEAYASVIDQIRANSSAEILVTTGAAGSNGDPRGVADWSYNIDPIGTSFRDRLSRVATLKNVGFLDTFASWGNAVSLLPGSTPYDTVLRDPVHMNHYGAAIAGRTFSEFFAVPEPTTAILVLACFAAGLRRRAR